jgi:hypothetical protein
MCERGLRLGHAKQIMTTIEQSRRGVPSSIVRGRQARQIHDAVIGSNGHPAQCFIQSAARPSRQDTPGTSQKHEIPNGARLG